VSDAPGFRDFALRLRSDATGGLVLVRPTPHGDRELGPFEPPIELAQLDLLLASLARQPRGEGERVRGVERLPSAERESLLDELPVRLHRALFPPEVFQAYHYELGAASAVADVGVRLRLILDPADPACRPWCALPWELVAAPEQASPLALNPFRAVVRSLPLPGEARQSPPEPPREALRVLLLGASPPGQPALDLAAEVREIRRQAPTLRIDLMEPATAAGLREALARTGAQVLHFLGHGDLEGPQGRGRLLFAREGDGGEDWVDSQELGTWLAGLPRLRLVVVNACWGAHFARREGIDPWSGVAQELLRQGVPAVVAHQLPISDRAAIAFSGGFYRELAASRSIETAMAEGRQAISVACRGSREWATPVLYQQGVGTPLPAPARRLPPRPGRLDQSHLVRARTQGFVGREWAFHQLERFLARMRNQEEGGYFMVLGDPGIGKTSLLAEAARRKGWNHHFALRNRNEGTTACCLSNLAAQLCDRFALAQEEPSSGTGYDSGAFERVLARVADQRGPGEEPVVIVVDALDEAEDRLEGNPLALPPFLPRGIVLLVSSQRVERPLDVRCLRDELDIDALSPENGADVVAYLRRWLENPSVSRYRRAHGYDEQQWLETLTQKSAGNFMYLRCVLFDLESERDDLDPLEALPVGLVGYYEQHWARMRGRGGRRFEDETLPVVKALAAAKAPLALEQIAHRADLKDGRRVVAALRELRPFLEVSDARDEEGPFRLYRFYHESFRGFLNSQAEVFSLRAAHGETVERLLGP
jgi:hypothetical protein